MLPPAGTSSNASARLRPKMACDSCLPDALEDAAIQHAADVMRTIAGIGDLLTHPRRQAGERQRPSPPRRPVAGSPGEQTAETSRTRRRDFRAGQRWRSRQRVRKGKVCLVSRATRQRSISPPGSVMAGFHEVARTDRHAAGDNQHVRVRSRGARLRSVAASSSTQCSTEDDGRAALRTSAWRSGVFES